MVVLDDGRAVVIGTDGSWRSSTGPVTSADLYEGEHYDARLEQPGWSAPGFDDSAWLPCSVTDFDAGTLVAPDGPPVRPAAEVPVSEVLTSPSGRTLLDFGQNLVGALRIRVSGASGTVVTLRCSSRGSCTSASATWTCCAASTRACAPGWTGSPPRSAPEPCSTSRPSS